MGSTQRQAGQAETISSTKIDAKYRPRGDYGPFMGEGKVLEGYLSFCKTNLYFSSARNMNQTIQRMWRLAYQSRNGDTHIGM